MSNIMSDDEFKAKMILHMEESKKFQSKMELAVLGNDELEIDGLVEKVSRHEKYIQSDKKLKAKIAGGVAVGTPILIIIWDRIKHFIGL